MTETEAAQAVAIALAACPQHAARLDRAAVADMVKAWTMLLEDVSAAEVAAALKRYLATSKWLPAASEIRTIVAESRHGRRRPGADAWGDVLKAVGRYGMNRSPAFDDPLVAHCVARLGWRELCLSENATADRARFIELYDQQARAAAEDAVVGALPGAATPALPGGAAPPASQLVGRTAKALIGKVGT